MEIKIQQFTEQEEWVDFKIVNDDGTVKDWDATVKEVFTLNQSISTNEDETLVGKYRAVAVNDFLTHIYCSSFYTVPTIRSW